MWSAGPIVCRRKQENDRYEDFLNYYFLARFHLWFERTKCSGKKKTLTVNHEWRVRVWKITKSVTNSDALVGEWTYIEGLARPDDMPNFLVRVIVLQGYLYEFVKKIDIWPEVSDCAKREGEWERERMKTITKSSARQTTNDDLFLTRSMITNRPLPITIDMNDWFILTWYRLSCFEIHHMINLTLN